MSASPSVLGGDGAVAGRKLVYLRLMVFGVALVVALLAIFAIWGLQSSVAQTNDLYSFAELGRNIAEGRGLRLDGGVLTIRRAPGYPALIALLYLVFGYHQVVIQLAQALFAAGTCLLAFEIGRKIFSVRVGLIAAAITALHPMVMRYVPDIQLECFLTFLYTLTVYRTVRLVEEGTVLNGVWLGLAAAVASMVKAVTLPYMALFVLAYLIFRRWQRARAAGGPIIPGLGPIVAMIFAMGLVILPWTYRNYNLTGTFVLISGNASGEFLRGYVFAQPRYYLLKDAPYVVGELEANQMQIDLFKKQGLVWERDEVETEHVQNAAMKEKVLASPAAFIKKVFIAAFMFWYVMTSPANSLLVGGLALGAWVLAVYGIVQTRGRGHAFWVLLLPIVSLNAIYALLLALGRYSAPCIPVLLVLAAFGVDRLAQRFAPARLAAPGS